MSNKAPNFFRLAVRPKWIGALLLSLAVAALFAALGQWQLDRAFTKDNAKFVSAAQTKQVTLDLSLDTNHAYVVADRLQKGNKGFWLVANATDQHMRSTTLALGWAPSLEQAEKARTNLMSSMLAQAFLPVTGTYLPSEPPQPADSSKPYLLKSVSLAQLINLYSPNQTMASNSQYLAVAKGDFGLQSISVTYVTPASINWLSAFYFLEWTLFAGFAVFLWWRLVKDEQLRLTAEAQADER